MEKGIIYIFIDWMIEKLKFLNLVELFKILASKISPSNKISSSRFAVDLFIILKWVFIILIWNFNITYKFVTGFVWYLIIANIFTYFYYHSWSKDLAKPHFDLDRVKRRFLSLILSINFNVLSFAYLFAQPYSSNFKWENGFSTLKDSLFYSAANSLITGYEPVSATNNFGYSLSLIETIVSFIFLTIILSNSIPQYKN